MQYEYGGNLDDVWLMQSIKKQTAFLIALVNEATIFSGTPQHFLALLNIFKLLLKF